MALKLLKAGKHSCVGHLSSPVAADSPGAVHFERPAMLVYVGQFESADGDVEVTEDGIDNIVSGHNAHLSAMLEQAKGDEAAFVRSMPPLQLDHSTNASETIGRVLGTMSKGPYQLKDGRTVMAMFNDRIRVLGAENIEKTKDGRYGPVSVGADLEKGPLTELSVVAFPAAEGASLLAKSKLSQGDPMHEKLKSHLMSSLKFSPEQADEHLGKLREHLKKHLGFDDAGADKHLEGLEPEGADKLSAVLAAGTKLADDVKEEEKKLAAKKPEIVRLAKGLKKDLGVARLALKAASIGSRLSKLQASAKITPAERKKLDLKRLAGLTDSALEEAMLSYENREPVIDPRVHGTTKAVNLSKLQKDHRIAHLTAEAKKDLGLDLDDKDRKALEASVPQGAQATDAGDPGQHDENLKHLLALVGDHPQKDAILAHVGKMTAAGAPVPPESVDHDEKQMSGLVENVNRLHTEFTDFVKITGEALGLGAAELAE